jgi:hypothetical protein
MITSILIYVSVFGLEDHCSLNMALTSNAHTYRLYFFNDQLALFLNSFAAMCKEIYCITNFIYPAIYKVI